MTLHLKVGKNSGQDALKKARSRSLVDESLEIQRDGDYLFIPVRDVSREDATLLGELVDIAGEERRKKVLPQGIKGSYDVIGSIVIMKKSNVRDPVKLAENLLKRKGIESVFLDHGVVGENRTRNLTLLAGKDNRQALYRENGIILKVDVEKAYFSPRLATERMLVANSVQDGERIVDMFAGIGPFSILMARMHECRIIAMDHNEAAISLLRENMKLNRLSGTIEAIHCDSGKEIGKYRDLDRIVMNLPHGAFPFLSEAYRAIRPGGTINFYEVSSVEGITERMQAIREMGLDLRSKREVHGYSKNEYMYSLELHRPS